MKVSVVVPVWNPGPNLQRCLDSLLGQTMAPQDYELVLVDDGSTDGTGERLDALAAQLGNRVQVLHIPNSGWPGKPRNVGVAAARGEYVQFVDNDDVIAPEALEELYELGASTDADVVIGKLSSDFRGVNHTVFRETVTRRTLADFPLVETLTPHKMFNREFLNRHEIRYPEGPTHLEDQLFVMRAYVKAHSVALLADRACYFYLRRLGSGRNAGDIPMVPSEYYGALEQVLQVIAADVPRGPLRDRLYRRFYRVELLGRLSGAAMLGYEPGYRADLAAEVRRLVDTYLDPGVHDLSGAATRIQGRLLRDGHLDGLVALAEEYRAVALRAAAHGPRWIDGRLVMDVDAALYHRDQLLRCEPADDGWALPAALAPGVPVAERLLNDAVEESDVELSLVSRTDAASFGRVDGLRVRVDRTGVVRAGGTVAIDPSTAMGGRPLTPGLWDFRLRLRFAGWSLGSVLRPGAAGREKRPPTPPMIGRDGTPLITYWTRPNPSLALDVGQWMRSLTAERAAAVVVHPPRRNVARVVVPLEVAPDAPLPGVEVMFEPERGAVVSVDGRFDGGPSASVRLPKLADGVWRVWFRLGEPGSAAPGATPWQLRVRRGRARVEQVPG